MSWRIAWRGKAHTHLVTRSEEFCVNIKETQERNGREELGPSLHKKEKSVGFFLYTLVLPMKLHRINLILLQQNKLSSYLKLLHPTVFSPKLDIPSSFRHFFI